MLTENRAAVLITKVIAHTAALLPLLWLVYAINSQALGAEPTKDIQHFTGLIALRLLITVALIPILAHFLRFNTLFQTRKLLGLWCFVWSLLHLCSYLLLEIGWNNLSLFFSEVFSHLYLVIGAVCWLSLFIMAISSFGCIRSRLGMWWKRIHYLLYPTLLMIIFHYVLSMKTMTPEPILYAILTMAAIAYRYKNLIVKHK